MVLGATFPRQNDKNATTLRCRQMSFPKVVCRRAENTATVTIGALQLETRITLMEDRGNKTRKQARKAPQISSKLC